MDYKTRVAGSLVAVAADVWAAATWAWESRLSILEQIGPPEYAAAITFFTGAVIALNWLWVNRLRPSTRFSELRDEIQWAVRILSFPPGMDNADKVRMEILRIKLTRLGIRIQGTPSEWAEVLILADLGDIGKARHCTQMH